MTIAILMLCVMASWPLSRPVVKAVNALVEKK